MNFQGQTLNSSNKLRLLVATHDSAARRSRDDLVNVIFEKAGIKLVRGRTFDEIVNQIEVEQREPLGEKFNTEEYESAKEVIKTLKAVTTADLQRRLRIGYAKAKSLLDKLEEDGLVSQSDGVGSSRKVYMNEARAS